MALGKTRDGRLVPTVPFRRVGGTVQFSLPNLVSDFGNSREGILLALSQV